MYYIERDINYRIDFISSVTKKYHFISRLMVDYVNKECQFEISSFDTEEEFKNNKNSFVTFLNINAVPNFDIDPNLFIWRCLISEENSPFYKSEIKRDFSIKKIEDKENESILE